MMYLGLPWVDFNPLNWVFLNFSLKKLNFWRQFRSILFYSHGFLPDGATQGLTAVVARKFKFEEMDTKFKNVL